MSACTFHGTETRTEGLGVEEGGTPRWQVSKGTRLRRVKLMRRARHAARHGGMDTYPRCIPVCTCIHQQLYDVRVVSKHTAVQGCVAGSIRLSPVSKGGGAAEKSRSHHLYTDTPCRNGAQSRHRAGKALSPHTHNAGARALQQQGTAYRGSIGVRLPRQQQLHDVRMAREAGGEQRGCPRVALHAPPCAHTRTVRYR